MDKAFILVAVSDVVANWENIESVEVVMNDKGKPDVVAFFKSGRQTKLYPFNTFPDALGMLAKIRDDILHCGNSVIDSETRRDAN